MSRLTAHALALLKNSDGADKEKVGAWQIEIRYLGFANARKSLEDGSCFRRLRSHGILEGGLLWNRSGQTEMARVNFRLALDPATGTNKLIGKRESLSN